jgi:hypothetical protein
LHFSPEPYRWTGSLNRRRKPARHTVRGQSGGTRLARAPEAIHIGAEQRHTEADLRIARRFGSSTARCIEPSWVLQRLLGDALAVLLVVLDGMNLANLIRPRRQLSVSLWLEPAEQKQNWSTAGGELRADPVLAEGAAGCYD